MSYPTFLSRVEREIRDERARQDDRWGEQNHPDGTGGFFAEVNRDTVRERCQRAAARGLVDWRLILSEEVFEAFAEEDPPKLRAELIQAAAVIVAWVECMDRRAAAAAPGA